MSGLTRFMKGDTIKMKKQHFQLLSNAYYSEEYEQVICETDTEKGWVSYYDMIKYNAKIIKP